MIHYDCNPKKRCIFAVSHENYLTVQGPVGPQGPQGIPGPQGVQGLSLIHIYHNNTDAQRDIKALPCQKGRQPGTFEFRVFHTLYPPKK